MSKIPVNKLFRKKIIGDFEFLNKPPERNNMHIESYNNFLQKNVPINERKKQGLEGIFQSFFPIINEKNSTELYYNGYEVKDSEFSVEECKRRGISYTVKIKVFLQIKNTKTGDSKEIINFLGDIPTITNTGTFVINGYEKIFISQMQKAPGVLFEKEIDANLMKKNFTAKIQPAIGSWIYLTLEKIKNVEYIFVSIDKKKKFPITTFLLCFPKKMKLGEYCLGYDIDEILGYFYKKFDASFDGKYWNLTINKNRYARKKVPHEIIVDKKVIIKKGEVLFDEIKDKIPADGKIQVSEQGIKGFFLAEDILSDKETIFLENGKKIDKESDIAFLTKRKQVSFYRIDPFNPDYILNSLNYENENITTREAALKRWATAVQIGTHHGKSGLHDSFVMRFSNPRYYEMQNCRNRINSLLGIDQTENYLTLLDVIHTSLHLIKVKEGLKKADDIDSLEHKVLAPAGVIFTELFRNAMIQFERDSDLREKLNYEKESLINLNRLYFKIMYGVHLQSQTYENTNGLSGLVQERKIITKSQADSTKNTRMPTASRNIKLTQAGRICFTQTPEGPNLGLTTHIDAAAEINKNGFLLATYYKVQEDGSIPKEEIRLAAYDDHDKVIAFASDYDEKKVKDKIFLVPKTEMVRVKVDESFLYVHYSKVDLIIPESLGSISARAIPFNNRNAVFRNITGANMSSQAVPLIKSQVPFISTGMDEILSCAIKARKSGKVIRVDSQRVIIQNTDGFIDIYSLLHNVRTNSETCISYSPTVILNQEVVEGENIIDGFTTTKGYLSLGRNLLVAFKEDGSTYEDAMICSERVVHENLLTTHERRDISCVVTDTKNGPENNTRDFSGASYEKLKLDECGVIVNGSVVNSGDIIFGKVTPQESGISVSSEQKLISAILGMKSEYKSTPIRLEHGISGTVIGLDILTAKGIKKDDRTIMEDQYKILQLEEKFAESMNLLRDYGEEFLINNLLIKFPKLHNLGKKIFNFKTFDEKNFLNIQTQIVEEITGEKQKEKVQKYLDYYFMEFRILIANREQEIIRINEGCDINQDETILKKFDIKLLKKRPLAVGDKLCGRHGNKGVISEVRSIADMPYLEDGTKIDLVMNSISVLARRNLGQMYETTMGSLIFQIEQLFKKVLKYKQSEDLKKAHHILGLLIQKPEEKSFFDIDSVEKLKEDEIYALIDYFAKNGVYFMFEQYRDFSLADIKKMFTDYLGSPEMKMTLYDGFTGEKYTRKVLVGYQYIYRLNHTAENKIHGRSTGPYSLLTHQPTHGKSKQGGQKVGEMENWAIQAHGAAMTSEEKMKSCSDDEDSRRTLMNSIVKYGKIYGDFTLNRNGKFRWPDSFIYLKCMLNGLNFGIKVLENPEDIIEVN